MDFKSASVLIGFQVILLISFVESQATTSTTEAPIDETTTLNKECHQNPFPGHKNIYMHFYGAGDSPKLPTSFITTFLKHIMHAVPTDDYVPDLIVGGERSLPEEFPFMAALGWLDNSQTLNFVGGGMLISSKMVLTAAHCVYKREPPLVLIGGYPISKIPLYQSKIYSVANVTIFPGYDPSQNYHDIAILELDRSVSTPPICLWTSPNLISNDVTAIGYGLLNFGGRLPKELWQVNLKVYSSESCEPFFKKSFKRGLSNAHIICAGDKDNGEKDTCEGDSGGPLLVRHNNTMFAVGVTSEGIACSGDPPAIYIKISEYMKWITWVLRDRKQSLLNCIN